jgi:hypothetical protein
MYLGGTALVGSPADFGKLIADETEKLGTMNVRLVTERNIEASSRSSRAARDISVEGFAVKLAAAPTTVRARTGESASWAHDI